MALINRISRLFKADFNAVLDQIEEPEQLLKQAIRDMEDELAKIEQEISSCAHEQETLGVRRGELDSSIGEIDTQLDLCFESGKDDLAKSLIRKKLETERVLKSLNAKLEANERYLGEQGKRFEQNEITLDGLRQKAEIFSHQRSVNQSHSNFDDMSWASREAGIGDADVEIAFLREQASRGAA